MSGNGNSPESRAVRFVLIAPSVAGAIIYGFRHWVPQAWLALKWAWADIWALMLFRSTFTYLGRLYTPGVWAFHNDLVYLDRFPLASIVIAGSLAIGVVVALAFNAFLIKISTRHNGIIKGKKG